MIKINAIAIIPARGGSKRIPHKNIRDFLGRPIISYAIKAALKSGCFSEVMVSTDDKEIADVAKSFGASVPFFRSEKNSDDFSTLADVANEVLLKYAENGQKFKYFCCILPTAPLVSATLVKKAYKLLNDTRSDGVVPVVQFSYPIQRALKLKNNKLKMFSRKSYNARSQDLPVAYHDSGQLYWLKTNIFLKKQKFFIGNTRVIQLSEMEVQDIDTADDWKLAELKYKLINGGKNEVL